MLPHIAIPSYLGKTKETRAKRLASHIQQRQVLSDCFPKLKIVSLCSDYSPEEKKQLKGFTCDFIPGGRMHKYLKHNMVLEELYNQKRRKAVLLLDDDATPMTEREEPFQNTADVCTEWLTQDMPNLCTYFSCYGLLFDAFNAPRIRKDGAIVPAPLQVVGWAVMMRHDLKVLYTDKTCIEPKTKFVLDDMPFRCKCYAEEKPVMKHLACYFNSYHKSNNRATAFFKDREHEMAVRDAHLKYLVIKHPRHFEMLVNGRVRFKKDKRRGFFD